MIADGLINMLKNYSNDEIVQRNASGALANLASDHGI